MIVAVSGSDAGASAAGATAATRKDALTGAGTVESTRRHAAPAGAAQDARGDGGATTKKAAVDAAHVILTVSPVKGSTGSATVSGARAAGHDTTAIVAAAPAGGDAPGSVGAATASVGSAQPSVRKTQELGGGVRVGDCVGERDDAVEGVCVADDEPLGVIDDDGEPIADFDDVGDGELVGVVVESGVGDLDVV